MGFKLKTLPVGRTPSTLFDHQLFENVLIVLHYRRVDLCLHARFRHKTHYRYAGHRARFTNTKSSETYSLFCPTVEVTPAYMLDLSTVL